MFLVHLWNYIRGYVIIIVTGRSIERFINICSKRQILLWDIVRADMDSASMKASIRVSPDAAGSKKSDAGSIKKMGYFLYRFKEGL